MTHVLTKLTAPLFLTLSLAGVPASAGAGDPPAVTVDYADLDLTTKAGQKTFDRRLDAAFRIICRATFAASWRSSIAQRDCRIALQEQYLPMRNAAIAEAEVTRPELGLVDTQR